MKQVDGMAAMRGRTPRRRWMGSRACGGFSLVELLVVITIIVVVIALVLPALGGARNVAKMSTSKTVMKELGNAVDRFRQDNGRLPGVFSPFEMGHRDNASRYGFTGMENVILDLAGGVVTEGSGPNSGGLGGSKTRQLFGPSDQARQDNRDLGRFVNEELIGADVEGNPAYYQPDKKFFVAQKHGLGEQQWSSVPFKPNSNEANIPDVVDAFGQPLLLWAEDEAGPDEITRVEDFAEIDTSNDPARFYWASNAGLLKSKALGDKGHDQTTANASAHSLLGDGVSDTHLRLTLAGLLGSPAFPTRTDLSGLVIDDMFPASSRGGIIVQSAGIDGYYLGIKDKGSRKIDADGTAMRYGNSFFTGGGTRHLEDNLPVTIDPFEAFDDSLQSYGK